MTTSTASFCTAYGCTKEVRGCDLGRCPRHSPRELFVLQATFDQVMQTGEALVPAALGLRLGEEVDLREGLAASYPGQRLYTGRSAYGQVGAITPQPGQMALVRFG